jgi:hypothetical protein
MKTIRVPISKMRDSNINMYGVPYMLKSGKHGSGGMLCMARGGVSNTGASIKKGMRKKCAMAPPASNMSRAAPMGRSSIGVEKPKAMSRKKDDYSDDIML